MSTPRKALAVLAAALLFAGGYLFGRWRAERPILGASTSSTAPSSPVELRPSAESRAGESAEDLSAGSRQPIALPQPPPPAAVPVVATVARPTQPLPDTGEDLGGGSDFPSSLRSDPFYNPEAKRLTRAESDRLSDMIRQFNINVAAFRQGPMHQATDRHVDAMIAAGFYRNAQAGEPMRPERRGNAGALRNGRFVEFDPKQVPEIVAARAELDAMIARYQLEIVSFFENVQGQQ